MDSFVFQLLRCIVDCLYVTMLWFDYLLTALLHDKTINLRIPTEPNEQWIQVIIANLNVGCQTPMSVNIVQVISDTDLQQQLTKSKFNSNSLITTSIVSLY